METEGAEPELSLAQRNTSASRVPVPTATPGVPWTPTPPWLTPFRPPTRRPRGGTLTWALLQEAVSSLHPVALALGAPVGRPIALPGALLPALGAAGRAGAPA